MSDEDDIICPICRDSLKDIFVTSCGHTFCGPCICSYMLRCVTGAHGAATHACPACRQPVRLCSTTSGSTSVVVASFKMGKILLEVDVKVRRGAIARVSQLLQVKPSTIKFVHKGQVLHKESDVWAAASHNSTITLLPARVNRNWSRMIWLLLYSAVLKAWAFTLRLLRPLWLRAEPIRSYLSGMATVLKAFFISAVNVEYDVAAPDRSSSQQQRQ